MNLHEAASGGSVLNAALAYAEAGLSVLPLEGKKPPTLKSGLQMAWSHRQHTRATFSMIHEWAHRGLLQNVGIVTGAISGNVAVIDLDGEQAVEEFAAAFPTLLETHFVVTGSGKGAHYYYRCQNLPTTTRTKGFELRANGCYVVAPPSTHPDTGMIYRAGAMFPVLHVQDLELVKAWILGKIAPVRPVRSEEWKANRTIGSEYGRRALESEIRLVSRAPHGSRNNALNRAAYNLGQLVADGALSRMGVEAALLGAAMACGLDEVTSARTIKSGLDAGILKPRSEMFKQRGKRS